MFLLLNKYNKLFLSKRVNFSLNKLSKLVRIL